MTDDLDAMIAAQAANLKALRAIRRRARNPERQREYRQRPGVPAAQREYQRKYYQRTKTKKHEYYLARKSRRKAARPK